MLTTGRVRPVFPSVRCNTGEAEVSSVGLAGSTFVFANTLAVPAHRIGFTMNSRRFHFPRFFMAQLLKNRFHGFMNVFKFFREGSVLQPSEFPPHRPGDSAAR